MSSKLTGSRIVLTGGAGLIGSHIADQLIDLKPRQIIIFDDFSRGLRSNLQPTFDKSGELIHVEEADITDARAVDRIFKGADYVFHLAAIRITRCAEEPRLALRIMVDGTYNVMEACVKHRIKRLVASSSASVYGLAAHFPTSETDALYGNRTFYGATKVANEQMLRAFNAMYGLNYVALRYFNVYGPRMDTSGAYTEVMIRWLDCIDAMKPPLIFGDGGQTMDFVYVEDVARANILAMEAETVDQYYNVGSGISTSLLDLLHLILHITGSGLHPEFRESRVVGNVTQRLADTKKAAVELGFVADIKLEEGLKKLIEWRKNSRV